MLLDCSLGEGLHNIRRSWKRLKRRLAEAVSCHMDDMYLSREWSHFNGVTVQPENISDLIPRARKIEFESCK